MGGTIVPADGVVLAGPPPVTFAKDNIGPPSPFYTVPDDQLIVDFLTLTAGLTFEITARFMQTDGRIIAIDQFFTPTSLGSVAGVQIPLGYGYLLDVAVRRSAGSPRVGQCFCRIGITRGVGATLVYVALLAQGYVALMGTLGWPGGPIRQSTEGPGFINTRNVANPGAGADWTFTVPAGLRIRPQLAFCGLTCSAAVANRIPHASVNPVAGTAAWQMGTNVAVTASQVVTLAFMGGATVTNDAGAGTSFGNPKGFTLPLPPGLMLFQGDQMGTSTPGLQGADQYSLITLYTEEWMES